MSTLLDPETWVYTGMPEDLNYAGGQPRVLSSSLKINASLSDIKGRKRQGVAQNLYIYKSPMKLIAPNLYKKSAKASFPSI